MELSLQGSLLACVMLCRCICCACPSSANPLPPPPHTCMSMFALPCLFSTPPLGAWGMAPDLISASSSGSSSSLGGNWGMGRGRRAGKQALRPAACGKLSTGRVHVIWQVHNTSQHIAVWYSAAYANQSNTVGSGPWTAMQLDWCYQPSPDTHTSHQLPRTAQETPTTKGLLWHY
jgi:hypothetical protein